MKITGTSAMRSVRLAALAAAGVAMLPAQAFPNNPSTAASNACPVTAATFNSWFVSGTPSLNGVVNPANSVTFPSIPNCSFYAWASQMFLWLNSPAPVSYGGGGGRIFDSPAFYDVSPPDASGQRTFIPHTAGFVRALSVRVPKLGPHGLPVLVDTSGRILEVAPTKVTPAGTQLIQDQTGVLREIGKVTLAPNRKVAFQDTAGKPIQPLLAAAFKMPVPKAANATVAGPITVQRFMMGNIPIFIDPAGNVVNVEQGQADGSVLLAQNGSLVYFVSMVNDVYAYFLTGLKDGGISPAPTQFPTTQANLNAITTFATAHGKTFPDPTALAVEVKTAWVEAAGLANLNNYITTQATIPTYNKSNPNQWVPNGQKTVQLALVGMHVVGSTAQHPEMVWATFEHFSNAPNGAYSYIDAANATIQVPQSTAGTWLFSASGGTGPFDVGRAITSGADIVSNPQLSPAQTIGAANVMRWNAFGMPSGNPTSNTQLISIHHAVSTMMPVGDIRGNYYLSGATWTIPGSAPPSSQVGTNQLTNSTLETFVQPTCSSASQNPCTTFAPGLNCLDCHTSLTPGILSHIFGGATTGLKPLF
jgi:hypothetical protein